MEVFGNPRLETYGATTVRKKRSLISRRPRLDQSLPFLESRSPSDDAISDGNSSDDTIGRKEINLNQNGFGDHAKRHSEGVLAPANWKSLSKTNPGQSVGNLDIDGITDRVKKVKLKVCGISRTIQSKSIAEDLTGHGSSSARSRQKSLYQDDSNGRGGDQSDDPVRKSKRVPKRRVLDGAFEEEEEDDEIGYLEKLKISKAAFAKKSLEEDSSSKKLHPISRVYKNGKNVDVKKKARSNDTDYEDEKEEEDDDLAISDGKKARKQKKEQTELITESKREPALTTRQRALLSSSGPTIEFPNGLPPAPSRKQKEKLSEVEQQLKKAEAAKKRKLQVEKAARESEAEAIKKILGQDSSRKKREDKVKKRQEELAQEKAANALKHASSTVRWVIGPNGTTVTFPEEMGLPSLFDPKPKGYPPPRETCAGPSCSNPYKYRHSKSKLPLCSLKCYKAVDSIETKVEEDDGKDKLAAETAEANQPGI
ncbi:transcriptional regulator ATRX homolog [Impatiens glandulifera]|uniref:transcriptional regulator ATRX homolog n=1 Tax=Impatiens glandulifera TaxID=253017 RepID=UPI001FB11E17|nr:transcriptional regulator ATRX homolog [Impatiens glandulifera]